jgi:hypothetical protein
MTLVPIEADELEALVMAAALVRDIRNVVTAHKSDAAIQRTEQRVADAMNIAMRAVNESRRIKDPMEDEPATKFEIDILNRISNGEHEALNPLIANDMRRKRLVVMGHMFATIEWGDKTKEVQPSDRVLWKLTEKGALACISSGEQKKIA